MTEEQIYNYAKILVDFTILKHKYQTIPGRDKDFISAPKSNM